MGTRLRTSRKALYPDISLRPHPLHTIRSHGPERAMPGILWALTSDPVGRAELMRLFLPISAVPQRTVGKREARIVSRAEGERPCSILEPAQGEAWPKKPRPWLRLVTGPSWPLPVKADWLHVALGCPPLIPTSQSALTFLYPGTSSAW